MEKILSIADVHIADYPARDPRPFYFLDQVKIVADNIIKVGKGNSCDYLVIAGDLLEKCTNRPFILSEAKSFLLKLSKNFNKIFVISGNHDIDDKIRSSEQLLRDIGFGTILPDNCIYMDKQIINLGNLKIGFSNWQKEFDLSWIKDKVDILFTHATINYGFGDAIKSQVLDESKFDLAICGDIHRATSIGKYVSIGVPQKCKMGDSSDSTGVIVDCETGKWNHVNLNPDDNLLKLEYTDDYSKDGYDSTSNTMYFYKVSGDSEDSIESVADWEKVDNLIEDTIKQNNLEDIHSQVINSISDLDEGEVDFNFVLTKLYCKNWKSIEEATVNFDKGFKYLIQGQNGAGKTSFIEAIRYAFLDCNECRDKEDIFSSSVRSLEDFVRMGTKVCIAEVEFIYKGNKVRLRRSNKFDECGLWIDGVELKYGGKKNFEQDVVQRFPFIKFLSKFFLDANNNKFIGNLTEKRKSELISKFLKLNKIDTLNDAAQVFSDELKKELNENDKQIKEQEKVSGFIETKLAAITVPPESKENLERRKQKGLEIQRKNAEWNKFVNNNALLKANLENSKAKLEESKKLVLTFKNESDLLKEIEDKRKLISNYQENQLSIKSSKSELDLKTYELSNLRNSFMKIKKELNEIEEGKPCPHCGQLIVASESLLKHKSELEEESKELIEKGKVLSEEVNKLKEEWNTSEIEINNIQKNIDEINKDITNISYVINYQKEVFNNIDKLKDSILSYENELKTLVAPEEVDLPDNFMSIMTFIQENILIWDSLNSLSKDKANSDKTLEDLRKKQEDIQSIYEKYQKYLSMTSSTGILYKEIFTKLANRFSDKTVRYDVASRVFLGKERLDLVLSFNNSGNWIKYDYCSSGQKTILDIHFMHKLISNLGILVLDEFLKHLDQANHELCINMLSDMKLNCLLLSSHNDFITKFYDRIINLDINKGCTEITII